jgi:hypothetical protein
MSKASELLATAMYDIDDVLYEPIGEIVQTDFRGFGLDWWARRVRITSIRVGGSYRRKVTYYCDSVELDLSKLYKTEGEAKEQGRRIAEDKLQSELRKLNSELEAKKMQISELETAIEPTKVSRGSVEDE